MLRRLQSFVLALAFVSVAAAGAGAQGLQTGVLTGTLTSTDGATLPGATVTVESPALQGVQSTVSDVNGVYVLRGLPPGQYTVTVEMSGLSTAKKQVAVPLGQTVTYDAVLTVASVSESVTVAAEAAPVVTNITGGANYNSRLINELPVGRTPFSIAEMAPGLTDNSTAGQVQISGSFGYDNVFMVNGVDVNDNIFGNANNLFIEDAIEETQVLTSGISAEYGRFSGGVINVVTKRGGDRFSGSYRANFNNPSWTDETPFENERNVTRQSKLSTIHEATAGGPIVRTKVWFFGAARFENSTTSPTFQQTGLPYESKVDNKRYEVKVTATPIQNHTFQGSWMDNKVTQTNRPGLAGSIDPRTLVTRDLPNDLFVVNYNGVLSSKLFATAQFSQKRFGFRNTGGTSTDIFDSPFRTLGILPGVGGPNLHYNAPFFDSTDPEDRNNKQIAGSLSYFLSSPRFGSHDLKAGGEWFRANNTGGNSQSSTGYVFFSDYLTNNGQIVYDAQGRLIPVFVPGRSRVTNWLPTRGASINIDTTSFYLHDHWTAGKHFTFDAGVRFESVQSEATGDIVGADTTTWVPRLGATYDVKGNGKVVLQSTYAHYSGKYSEAQFSGNSDVANPSNVRYLYNGPAGQGMDFAAGFNTANYNQVLDGSFPTANVFFEDGLHSPLTKEFTLSAGSQLNERAYVKGTYQWRTISGFIDDFITLDNGRTTVIRNGVDFGTFDNIVFRNTDEPQREYQAMLLQGRYLIAPRWTVEGHWTVQLKSEGNFEGEAANSPGSPTLFGDYPEVFDPNRNYPIGRFDDFQRHKVRVWSIYNLNLGRFGGVDLSGMYRFNSGQTFSYAAANVPLTDIQLAKDPGYANEPNGGVQTLFFGERGAGQFRGYALVDLGINYSIPVWAHLRPYIKLDVLNAFNNQKLIAWDTTVTPDFNGPKDANGLPLNYIRGSRFGQATANTHFPGYRAGQTGGRTFMLAAGFRF